MISEPVGCNPPHSAKFNGIRKIARRLPTAVIDTDKATSPPDRCVTMLDTLPGGQQATRIIPSATDPRTPRISVRQNVMNGSRMNCAAMAIEMARGRRMACRKSSMVVPSAMPNMIVAMTTRKITMEFSLNEIRMASTSPVAARTFMNSVMPHLFLIAIAEA